MSTRRPEVSVVMSVYNGADHLEETLDSVLSQKGCDLELIVVDDGSRDESLRILQEWSSSDLRIRLFHQENTGLTQALIRGCAAARGDFLARQDARDVSLPGRLARQIAVLEADPDVVMTSCGTRFVGPEGELLYEVAQKGDELHRGLSDPRLGRIRGPSHHASTMFCRVTYEAVGGYRPEFLVAQDLDLWMRMVEQGRCLATPEVLYQASWQAGSISHLRRRQQVVATKAIVECRERRRRGESEGPVLDRVAPQLAERGRGWSAPHGLVHARFHYFLGSTLARREPDRARWYLRRAVTLWPWHVKAWAKLASLALPPGRRAHRVD